MNKTYRNVAMAAGGILLVAVAGGLVKRTRGGDDGLIAQVLTANMTREEVYGALREDPTILNRALEVDGDVVIDFSDDLRVVEWSVPDRADLDGRLALIAAPGDRGTELHIAMRGEKYDVKDVVRHIKALLETGEIPTGARYR